MGSAVNVLRRAAPRAYKPSVTDWSRFRFGFEILISLFYSGRVLDLLLEAELILKQKAEHNGGDRKRCLHGRFPQSQPPPPDADAAGARRQTNPSDTQRSDNQTL